MRARLREIVRILREREKQGEGAAFVRLRAFAGQVQADIPTVRVRFDRTALARYGLQTGAAA